MKCVTKSWRSSPWARIALSASFSRASGPSRCCWRGIPSRPATRAILDHGDSRRHVVRAGEPVHARCAAGLVDAALGGHHARSAGRGCTCGCSKATPKRSFTCSRRWLSWLSIATGACCSRPRWSPSAIRWRGSRCCRTPTVIGAAAWSRLLHQSTYVVAETAMLMLTVHQSLKTVWDFSMQAARLQLANDDIQRDVERTHRRAGAQPRAIPADRRDHARHPLRARSGARAIHLHRAAGAKSCWAFPKRAGRNRASSMSCCRASAKPARAASWTNPCPAVSKRCVPWSSGDDRVVELRWTVVLRAQRTTCASCAA